MSSKISRLWTVGAGKGGVGKSFITASLGIALARQGHSVVAVDADFGSPNLHTFLGVKSPGQSLLGLLECQAAAEKALIPTSQPGLVLLNCAGDFLGAADPSPTEKEKIIHFILNLNADYVLADIGSGTSFNVLDSFNLSDEGIVVVTPDPAAIQRAYGFIKCALYRRIQKKFGANVSVAAAMQQLKQADADSRPHSILEFYDILCTTDPEITENIAALVDQYRPLILINMADSEEEQRVAEIIQTACKQFLNVNIRFCGLVLQDHAMRRATHCMVLLDFEDATCLASRQIQEAVQRLLNCSAEEESREAEALAAVTPIIGLDDRLEFMGKKLHIQTGNMDYTGRYITSRVYCEGRIILSAKSEYPSSLRNADDLGHVNILMRKQHFNVIREIEGKIIQLLSPAFNTHG